MRKREGENADALFAMKVLDKANVKKKGQVAHTQVREREREGLREGDRRQLVV